MLFTSMSDQDYRSCSPFSSQILGNMKGTGFYIWLQISYKDYNLSTLSTEYLPSCCVSFYLQSGLQLQNHVISWTRSGDCEVKIPNLKPKILGVCPYCCPRIWELIVHPMWM